MARRRTDLMPLREAGLRAAKRRFKEIFPGGFRDETYLDCLELHFDLRYQSRPNAETYAAMMELVAWLGRELAPWKPRDLIDIQGFFWVTSSEEYEDWPWE
ncbi:MAG TPA: hypothetical protein VF334_06895 [Polyangia bacterium]